MTAADVINAMSKIPPDTIVRLCVYGHSYDSRNHRGSHGPAVIWRDDDRVVFSDDCGTNRRENLDGNTLFADR